MMSLKCVACACDLRDGSECDRSDCPMNMLTKHVPTSLVNIEVTENELLERLEIRLNWSNDRHQIAEIKSRAPHDVIDALGNLVAILEHERRKGNI